MAPWRGREEIPEAAQAGDHVIVGEVGLLSLDLLLNQKVEISIACSSIIQQNYTTLPG